MEVIACVAVNDAHVMSKWAAANHVQDTEILMLADGDSSFTKALGYLSDQGNLSNAHHQHTPSTHTKCSGADLDSHVCSRTCTVCLVNAAPQHANVKP